MTDEDLIHAPAEPDLSQSGLQSSVPTAIEAMAKAYWAGWDDGEAWEDLDQDLQNSILRNIRAALLALAEADVSKEMINLGWGGGEDARHFDACFRAMLRALAKEEGQ